MYRYPVGTGTRRQARATRVNRVGEPEIETLNALSPTLEGSTERQKNPHPPRSLAHASWVIARPPPSQGQARRLELLLHATGANHHATRHGVLSRHPPWPPTRGGIATRCETPLGPSQGPPASICSWLVQERDGKHQLPASTVFAEPEIETLEAPPTLEGKPNGRRTHARLEALPRQAGWSLASAVGTAITNLRER
jgi:hypothetical protein